MVNEYWRLRVEQVEVVVRAKKIRILTRVASAFIAVMFILSPLSLLQYKHQMTEFLSMGTFGKSATVLMFLSIIILGCLFLYIAIKGNTPKYLEKYSHITRI